jgi:hypothetical protein
MPSASRQTPRAVHLIGDAPLKTVSHSASEHNSHYIIIPLTQGKFALVDIEDADLGMYQPTGCATRLQQYPFTMKVIWYIRRVSDSQIPPYLGEK